MAWDIREGSSSASNNNNVWGVCDKTESKGIESRRRFIIGVLILKKALK